MKKVFISQPMNGKSRFEIETENDKAVHEIFQHLITGYGLLPEEIEIIDSFMETEPNDVKPLWYLGEALKLLSLADFAYFAEGWESAGGCIIERICAVDYRIPSITFDDVKREGLGEKDDQNRKS